ncbi:hypothetical protein [Moraxella bovis]|uniref:Uncharacterized protein n=1 Tax=Moraxella bovis TaxID=476 RepID=A0A378Q0U4_MORBO|nr:hypothetical protein [Moraxella bovis]STY93818.1 Uncharacterised protein [Moraxella bovis]
MYVYPRIKGYAINVCDLPHYISPCVKHYYVFCAFWHGVNFIPYHGLYGALKEFVEKGVIE